MASNVDFGLWYDFRNPEPWQINFEQFYSERLDQIARAETMGFDSVWLTEHHFCDDGYTPSPLVIHAAIAARTERMRLGTNLMLLPGSGASSRPWAWPPSSRVAGRCAATSS
mgnify:CR=1 FL=1